MKLAIVVDSSSGLTEKQAKERGWHYLPLYLTIDGKEYRDGIDLTVDTFLDVYKKDSKTHTSCTPIGVQDVWPLESFLYTFKKVSTVKSTPSLYSLPSIVKYNGR